MISELRLIIFDLVGTTIQDNHEVPETFEEALAAHGIHITAEQMRNARGSSKREALQQLVPTSAPQFAESVYATFRERLINKFQTRPVRPIAHANEVIKLFREHEVRVVLNTGFDREITDLVIASCGWRNGTVDAVVCVDEVVKGRPAPDLIFRAMEITGISSVHQVANVGDTAIDLLAGFHAGVRWNIGVLSGAHNRAMLEKAPHTHLLESISELQSIFGES